ncbi:MAG: FAD-binding oxidoreductase [Nocardiaceae bacterium]|nr:FAD-binding oxidoreductase [Nocardiaceae bacterium]
MAEDHLAKLERLRASYRAIPPGEPIRLAKQTSNLFRARTHSHTRLDVRTFDSVLAVDAHSQTADVEGMCTYENLVRETLQVGLAPKVVPQLKTITLGGAVTGLGIESTSFRNGAPHESVIEMEILTGAGEIETVKPGDDLFNGFPNSYGTLGYATRLRIALEPVRKYVELEHQRFDELTTLQESLAHPPDVDYLDGVVFGPQESYLSLGRGSDTPGPTSDYTGQQIYYRSIQNKTTDLLTIHDYLWRWDTDWFWCSRAFGAQNPIVRRIWPRRMRRSDVYWKLMAISRRLPSTEERVVQDVEIPVENLAEFLFWFLRTIPITPIWICPITAQNSWPLYPLEPGHMYVNVGFWSSVPAGAQANIAIEAKVTELGGHKSLYSDSFYDRNTFDRLYGGDFYRGLKERYDPDRRLLNLYDKAVNRR